MKSKETTTHMTITVPVELKREMETRAEINWSRVAVKAFDRRLKAEKMLGLFAEEDITEEEAIQRGLRLRHKLIQRAK
jgi:hypothetical protein